MDVVFGGGESGSPWLQFSTVFSGGGRGVDARTASSLFKFEVSTGKPGRTLTEFALRHLIKFNRKATAKVRTKTVTRSTSFSAIHMRIPC